MSMNQRYGTYRGRGSVGKGLLAALLILVIFAALFVILLQRYVVYDETGSPRLDLPWQQEEELPEIPEEEQFPPLEHMEIVIQMPEEAISEPQDAGWDVLELPVPLTREDWMRANARAEVDYGDGLDAVVVTLKDAAGTVWFDSAAALTGTTDITADTAAVLEEVTAGEFHTVARISCFLDPKTANHYVTDRGLQGTNGYIFHDGKNRQWLDPGKPEARAFLCAVAAEIAALGFDEILLTDIGYPTEGHLEQIAYAEGDRSGHIRTFLQEMRLALAPYGVLLGVELPEAVIRDGSEEASGLVLSVIAPQVDCVYTRTAEVRAGELEMAVMMTSPAASFVALPEMETDSEAESAPQQR